MTTQISAEDPVPQPRGGSPGAQRRSRSSRPAIATSPRRTMNSSSWVTLRLLVQPLERHGTAQVSRSSRDASGPEAPSRSGMSRRQASLACTQSRRDGRRPSSSWARTAMRRASAREAGAGSVLAAPDLVPEPGDRVVADVGDPFLEGDDGVVGDVDVLGADLGAALGDVAQAKAHLLAEQLAAVAGLQGVHLELGVADEHARAGEAALVLLVVTDDVADVLAQEALDALVELLHPVDVLLGHPVGAVRLPGPGRERRHLLGHLVVERHVGDQVPDDREGAQGGDGDRLAPLEDVEPGHAQQPGAAVDLGRAGAALAGLAVPAHGQVAGLGRLDAVDGVQHHLAVLAGHGVVAQVPAAGVAAPQAQGDVVAGHELGFSSNSVCRSSGISSSGSRLTVTLPSRALTTILTLPSSGSGLG